MEDKRGEEGVLKVEWTLKDPEVRKKQEVIQARAMVKCKMDRETPMVTEMQIRLQVDLPFQDPQTQEHLKA